METKHTFVVLPFTPDILVDPSKLLPVIYRAALHSTESCTIIFSSPCSDNTQLYARLRKSPGRNWAQFQSFLGKVYAALSAGQWMSGRVLMDVEVRFDGEQGDWGDKLSFAKEEDKRLVVLQGESAYRPLTR